MAAHDRHRLSRRRFLGAMGASAGAAALNPGGAAATPARPPAARGRGFLAPEHFGRIFRLPPFARQSPKVEAALRELGRPGGLLDANDPLEAGPEAADRRSVAEREQPQQPRAHGGDDVLRPVPGPRHDLRCRLPARPADPATTRRATTARRR